MSESVWAPLGATASANRTSRGWCLATAPLQSDRSWMACHGFANYDPPASNLDGALRVATGADPAHGFRAHCPRAPRSPSVRLHVSKGGRAAALGSALANA